MFHFNWTLARPRNLGNQDFVPQFYLMTTPPTTKYFLFISSTSGHKEGLLSSYEESHRWRSYYFELYNHWRKSLPQNSLDQRWKTYQCLVQNTQCKYLHHIVVGIPTELLRNFILKLMLGIHVMSQSYFVILFSERGAISTWEYEQSECRELWMSS
jgi:hypothetical protein